MLQWNFFCLSFSSQLEFSHRCLIMYIVGLYESSLQNCFEIYFVFCEILCILLTLKQSLLLETAGAVAKSGLSLKAIYHNPNLRNQQKPWHHKRGLCQKNTVIGTNFIELFSTLEVERINIQKGPFKKYLTL